MQQGSWHIRHRVVRFLRGMVAVVAALSVTGGIVWLAARPASPDAFYEKGQSAPAEPGALLRQEPFMRGVPAGARAWRMLYATTRTDGTPAVASAIVVASALASGAPRPIVAWAHGTTGIVPGCAPSVMENPFANVPALDLLLREGWVFVATDYVGLGTGGGHAYLVGEEAARGVLDAVRAARRMREPALDDRVVVWGHSQGGNTAVWTGARAHDYAPDVRLIGVAAQAPATDLVALVGSVRATMFGKIVSAYLAMAYAAVYPDVRAVDYVRTDARHLAGDIASRCVGGWSTLVSVAQTLLLPSGGIFALDPTAGPLGTRLAQNSPGVPIPVPLFIAQGQRDDLVLPDIQQRYIATRCAAGQQVLYREYGGLDHVSLVAAASPLAADLVAWTRDRFEGRPAESNCG